MAAELPSLISKKVDEPDIDETAIGSFCIFIKQCVDIYSTHLDGASDGKFEDAIRCNYEHMLDNSEDNCMLRSLLNNWADETFLHDLFNRLTFNFDTKEFVGIVGAYFLNHINLQFLFSHENSCIKLEVNCSMDTRSVGYVSPEEALDFINDNKELIDDVFTTENDMLFIMPFVYEIVENAPQELISTDQLMNFLVDEHKILEISLTNTLDSDRVDFNLIDST